MSEPSTPRRAAAAELGADLVLDPGTEDVVAAIRDLTAGVGCDVAIVAVGNVRVAETAIAAVRRGGRVDLFAGFDPGSTIPLDPNRVHYDELHIAGVVDWTNGDAAGSSGVSERLIIDTDFGLMNDDAWATLLALRDPRAEVLGVCVTAGNFDLTSEARDARWILDRAGHGDVPVVAGAARPLVHERGPWEDRLWGGWARDAAERASAPLDLDDGVEFIVDQARAHPGEVTLLAIGPLTTVALALSREPRLPGLLRRIVAMGGAIGGLPRGGGNVTPLAEFNIWVDPEATRAVLRSGAALTLVPLNATRQVKFEEADLARIVAAGTPVAELFREHVLPAYSEPPGSYDREALYEYALCDPVTLACLLLPGACTSTRMHVEVETAPVLAYGTTYGYVIGDPPPPGMAHPESVKFLKREHLLPPDAWAWTGIVQPSHPPYWTPPPPEIDVVLEVDAAAIKHWFLETITR